jgi:hypothetical protein
MMRTAESSVSRSALVLRSQARGGDDCVYSGHDMNQNHSRGNENNDLYTCVSTAELPDPKTEGVTKTPRGLRILSLKEKIVKSC